MATRAASQTRSSTFAQARTIWRSLPPSKDGPSGSPKGTGLAGFTTGFLGPVAVGNALDFFGGAASASGWMAGYAVIAIGSAVAAWAVWRT